jgi:N-acetylneuraminic acid mutarotase
MSDPVIGNLPASIPADQVDFFQSMKSALEFMMGHGRYSDNERALRVRELANAGVNVSAFLKGSQNDPYLFSSATSSRVPKAPTGLTITKGAFTHTLKWTNPSDKNVSHIEVWGANGSQAIGDATMIGIVTVTNNNLGGEALYINSGLSVSDDWTYWVRSYSYGQKYSEWYPSLVTGGVTAQGDDTLADTIDEVIEILNGGLPEIYDPGYAYQFNERCRDAGGRVWVSEFLGDNQGNTPPAPGYWKRSGILMQGDVDGIPTVAVDGNLVVDGTILADAIAASQIRADHIDTGEIFVGMTIQSSNFVAGVSGWKIDQNGNFEVYGGSIHLGPGSTGYPNLDDTPDTSANWSGEAVPTLLNEPAVDWTTDAEKDAHIDDTYMRAEKEIYKFTKFPSPKNMYIFGGWNAGSRYNDLWRYDPPTDAWQQLTSGATVRSNPIAVPIDGKMYIFGGRGVSDYLNDLWCYDPSTDDWQQLTSGATARTYHTAVAIDGKMYIFGGQGNSGSLNDLWCYDPSTDAWQQLASGATARYDHTAIAIDGKIYIFGGRQGTFTDLNDIWRYDPSTDAWQQLTSGATVRSKHTATAIDGKMYIFGGWEVASYLNDIWCYDPSTDAWQQLTSGAIARVDHTATAVDGKMYIFGGRDVTTDLNDLWCYDPSTDDWQQLTSGATARTYHTATPLPVSGEYSYAWKLVATNDADIRSPNDPDLFDPTIIDPALAYTVGDPVNGPYAVFNAGELTFYQWFAGALRALKTLKQVDGAIIESGQWYTLEGYWANPPYVYAFSVDTLSYHQSYVAQSQKMRLGLTDVEQVSDGIYQVKGDSFLESQAGSTLVSPGLSCSGSSAANTASYGLPSNTRKITANLRFSGCCGEWFDGDYHRCYIYIRAKLVYYTGGAWVDSPWTAVYQVAHSSNQPAVISTPTTAQDITQAYLHIEKYSNTRSIYQVATGTDYVGGNLDTMTCSLAGGAVITLGHLGIICIGE